MIKDGADAPIHSSGARKEGSFFREILQKRIKQYLDAPENEPSFFDRGVPDSLAFFKYMGKAAPMALIHAVQKFRYNSTVFLLPFWEEIYKSDEVRKESIEQAKQLNRLIRDAYIESAYNILDIPESSVAERTQIIIDYIGQGSAY